MIRSFRGIGTVRGALKLFSAQAKIAIDKAAHASGTTKRMQNAPVSEAATVASGTHVRNAISLS
jgi:hypothetical protein